MTLLPPLARQLDLQPHPEGGWFRETWRSPVTFAPPGYEGTRSAATAIYFVLHPGERSRWHVVRSDELWFWHSGGPLTLRLGGDSPPGDGGPSDGGPSDRRPSDGGRPDGSPAAVVDVLLGPDVLSGQQPQALVPGGTWQCAAPATDEPVLVSCVVAPGFDYADFRLA
jgi:predicted cupin superfamily sugar epimerase